MSFHVGEDLGDYKIIAIIGAGSMGRVFQVEHKLTKRKEAVKVLSAELATEVQIQRFEREIALQSRLNHPNIAVAHNAACWEGCLILVTEFIDGETLEKLLSRGRLSIENGVEYIRQILSALSYAHEQGVIHRDINPANIIIAPDGVVKIIDFGVSKSFGDSQLTNCGDIVGCIDYMAPEQARSSSLADRRADLYSVGAILYQVLTGRKPFGDSRKFAPLAKDSESEPARPTELEPRLRPEWDEIVGKALMRDRDRRYLAASEFLQDIQKMRAATLQ
jgi:serine/threonine-protein kinase